jgi:hypothetical protein
MSNDEGMNKIRMTSQIHRMKITLLTIALALVSWQSIASAGRVDSRFDGKWIGKETYTYHMGREQAYIQATTVIGIAEGGQLFGVLSGFGTGRYEVSPKSSGNILIFRQAKAPKGSQFSVGRTECKLVLSTDGNTFKEDGVAAMPLGRGLMLCQVWGTFHRQGK